MSILSISQIVVAVTIIALILLQERSSGIGGAFGGGEGGGAYHTRRGLEKIIFYLTVILVIAFATLALVHLL